MMSLELWPYYALTPLALVALGHVVFAALAYLTHRNSVRRT